MIVTTDIGNILYRDCKAFGIGIVPAGIEPFASVYSNSLSDCTFLLYLL